MLSQSIDVKNLKHDSGIPIIPRLPQPEYKMSHKGKRNVFLLGLDLGRSQRILKNIEIDIEIEIDLSL